MSRIGTQPVVVPASVTVTIDKQNLIAKGPKGELPLTLPRGLKVTETEGLLLVERANDETALKALHGTFRSLLDNIVHGISEGWEKNLEIIGSGYRAAVVGKNLEMHMGYSHVVNLEIPEGLTAAVVKNVVTISGIDRQKVGQFSAIIRQVRKPEPYKGKGIRYQGEVVRRKAGKALKSGS